VFPDHLYLPYDPNPDAVVTAGPVRFTPFVIGSVQGDVRLAPPRRGHRVAVHGVTNPSHVTMLRRGAGG